MIDKVRTQDCSICNACINCCPQNAISLDNRNQGFIYPSIDEKKCVHCGMCENNCSVINPLCHKEEIGYPIGYAAQSLKPETRLDSTSGAVFFELGKYIIENGGFVCGAAFDSDFKVKHIITNDISEFLKMRGSKYVQSEIGDVYQEINKLIRS